MNSYVLEAEGISKRYLGTVDEPAVLRDVNLQLSLGETVAIVGPSGSGKSTLLNIIGLLDTPDTGLLRIEGSDTRRLPSKEKAILRNRSIGFVFQDHHLLPQCTVLENVVIPALVGTSVPERNEAKERAQSLLAQMGLEKRLRYFPAQLSGGERQRVAVVRALINNPSLVLADEPTGSLDIDAARNLADLLTKMNEELGTALIAVTHSEELAKSMMVKYRLRGGTLEK